MDETSRNVGIECTENCDCTGFPECLRGFFFLLKICEKLIKTRVPLCLWVEGQIILPNGIEINFIESLLFTTVCSVKPGVGCRVFKERSA